MMNLLTPPPHSDHTLLPGNHDVKNLEFTQPKNASAMVSAIVYTP